MLLRDGGMIISLISHPAGEARAHRYKIQEDRLVTPQFLAMAQRWSGKGSPPLILHLHLHLPHCFGNNIVHSVHYSRANATTS